VLDYHLHLWPHSESDAPLRLEQVADYCERARAAGVVEVALTEHLFRFVQAWPLVEGLWEETEPSAALRSSMEDYWAFHARNDLDAYVELALEAKRAGLPVVIGLEVDHYRGRMDAVADLLSGYPFDVLLGSVHWVGAWRFDDLSDDVSMAEWSVRSVDAAWDAYTEAMEELAASGACDVLAHPDLVKVTGRSPAHPAEWWDRIAEAAATGGMAAEVSSAGWRKPVGEQYPAQPLLARLVAHGVPLTTASDAHQLSHVADRADDMRAVLAEVGVSRLQGYRRRQAHTVAVEVGGVGGVGAAGAAVAAGPVAHGGPAGPTANGR
jgi:histidinol-phosphatase (PHP family)